MKRASLIVLFFALVNIKSRLEGLSLDEMIIPEGIKKLFAPEDPKFQEEIELLFDSKACVLALLKTIGGFLEDFRKQRGLLEQDVVVHEKNARLSGLTASFFGEAYPVDRLPKQYVGHEASFFTMKGVISKERVDSFLAHLREGGFSAELKSSKEKPSVVVDFKDIKIEDVRKFKWIL